MISESAEDKQKRVLAKYVPEVYVSYLHSLITLYPLNFKIVNPRKTKLGDFRYGKPGVRPAITVNGDLNPYSFLITSLHELAHFFAFKDYGLRIQPHGKEWQKTYRDLMLKTIDLKALPKDIEVALMQSLISVKASSCTDLNLFRVLKKYDHNANEKLLLEEIARGEVFQLQGKRFSRGELRRKRYLCTELSTNKKYLVSALAEVERVEVE